MKTSLFFGLLMSISAFAQNTTFFKPMDEVLCFEEEKNAYILGSIGAIKESGEVVINNNRQIILNSHDQENYDQVIRSLDGCERANPVSNYTDTVDGIMNGDYVVCNAEAEGYVGYVSSIRENGLLTMNISSIGVQGSDSALEAYYPAGSEGYFTTSNCRRFNDLMSEILLKYDATDSTHEFHRIDFDEQTYEPDTVLVDDIRKYFNTNPRTGDEVEINTKKKSNNR